MRGIRYMLSAPIADNPHRKPPSITSIQMMRAVAALAVVSMHICGFTSSVVSNDVWKGMAKFSSTYGHAGVDLFFVISGVVMYMITRRSPISNVRAAYEFIIHRIMRIYPLFWVTLLFAILSAGGSFRQLLSLDGIKDLTLYATPQLHLVSWTLSYEVRFYLTVAIILLVARKKLGIAFMAWGIGQLIASLLSAFGAISVNKFTYGLMTEFSMGLLVGAILTRKVVFKPIAILLIAFSWLFTSFIVVYAHADFITPYRHLLFGIPSAMALYSIVTLESNGGSVSPVFLCKIGDSSYSIYLWHYPILVYMTARWTVGSHSFSDGLMFAITAAAITSIVSIVSFFAIEKPSIKLGRLLTRSRLPVSGEKREMLQQFSDLGTDPRFPNPAAPGRSTSRSPRSSHS
jgi:exopolysaccharide production protein ExoZ